MVGPGCCLVGPRPYQARPWLRHCTGLKQRYYIASFSLQLLYIHTWNQGYFYYSWFTLYIKYTVEPFHYGHPCRPVPMPGGGVGGGGRIHLNPPSLAVEVHSCRMLHACILTNNSICKVIDVQYTWRRGLCKRCQSLFPPLYYLCFMLTSSWYD